MKLSHGAHDNLIPGWDAPFACPPDVVLTLPVPPKINKTRKIDWSGHGPHMTWRNRAHSSVLLVPRPQREPIKGRYTVDIVVSEGAKGDLDSTLKSLLDYLVHISLVTDDSPKYLRGISMRYGSIDDGFVRVTLRPIE